MKGEGQSCERGARGPSLFQVYSGGHGRADQGQKPDPSPQKEKKVRAGGFWCGERGGPAVAVTDYKNKEGRDTGRNPSERSPKSRRHAPRGLGKKSSRRGQPRGVVANIRDDAEGRSPAQERPKGVPLLLSKD